MSTDRIDTLQPPFYVIDLEAIRERLREVRSGFESQFDSVIVGYSYKTNYVPAMLEEIHEAGARAEVVSILEYRLARRIGVDPSRIVFNGPNKSRDAIAEALDGGAIVNLDSLREVRHAIEWARQEGKRAEFGVRVNVSHPEYSDHRNRSRFGLTDADLQRASEMVEGEDAEIVGLHTHLSTKARDLETFTRLAERIGEASDITGRDSLEYIDIGGGLGRAPDELDGLSFPSFEAYARRISETLSVYGLDDRTLIVEPGIAMVGDAVSFYTPVEVTKRIDGRNVAFVDGSIHNVKPTRHSHNLPTRVSNEDFEPKAGAEKEWDIVGYTCMDDDYIAVDQKLPALETGDILRIANVGAYTIVFNPPFIRTRPPIYTLDDGHYRLARRVESVDDFFGEYIIGNDRDRPQ